MVENGIGTVICAWSADKTFYIADRYITGWVDLLCRTCQLRDGLYRDIALVDNNPPLSISSMCFAANGMNGKTAPPDFIPARQVKILLR
jgi:hypothetical protein